MAGYKLFQKQIQSKYCTMDLLTTSLPLHRRLFYFKEYL